MRQFRLCLLLGLLALLISLPAAPVVQAQTTKEDVFLPFVSVVEPQGIFISRAEIMALPVSGAAWQNVLEWARESAANPDVGDRIDQTDAVVFAKALVYVRTGQPQYREQAVQGIMGAIGTEGSNDLLAVARNLTAYVVAADLVGLNGDDDAEFRAWLHQIRHKKFDDRSLIATHEERPNNWGTHAGAARIAAALYLGDSHDLQRAARVFQGWTGDRSAYAGFNFGPDLSWQCNPLQPVPVNPKGCLVGGFNLDGVLPDDQRRGGPLQWPPPKENYAWEALQGVVAQALMLERAGYAAFSWSDQALRRAGVWLNEHALFPAVGDDSGVPWLLNSVYGIDLSTESPARPGKNGLGFYDWLGSR